MANHQVPARDRAADNRMMNWRQRFKGHLPTAEQLQQHRWLRPVAHLVADRNLWRLRSESVARGVAVGVFWAFAVPFAQILFAAAHCVWWRGNIPVAAAITFITNPLTVGGWLWLAYQVGSSLIGPAPSPPDGMTPGWLATFGLPTILGMGLFAVGGAAVGYVVVNAVSRAWLWWRIMRRQRRQRG